MRPGGTPAAGTCRTAAFRSSRRKSSAASICSLLSKVFNLAMLSCLLCFIRASTTSISARASFVLSALGQFLQLPSSSAITTRCASGSGHGLDVLDRIPEGLHHKLCKQSKVGRPRHHACSIASPSVPFRALVSNLLKSLDKKRQSVLIGWSRKSTLSIGGRWTVHRGVDRAIVPPGRSVLASTPAAPQARIGSQTENSCRFALAMPFNEYEPPHRCGVVQSYTPACYRVESPEDQANHSPPCDGSQQRNPAASVADFLTDAPRATNGAKVHGCACQEARRVYA